MTATTQTSDDQVWADYVRRCFPFGTSTNLEYTKLRPQEPSVIVRATGCRVWDATEREFIDFRNGLGPVTLGHNHPAVTQAVREQLDNGLVYGQPSHLECVLADRLRQLIPGAEVVRFLKTGGEAVAATIRIARAYTGKKHVIQIGYNGWLNSLAADGRLRPGQSTSTTPAGVPDEVSSLHHQATWNDIAGIELLLQRFQGEVAAVVVASDYADMGSGATFYPALRHLTEAHGTLLVFDEIVTGFRIAMGGAQEYFGVTPDLSVFGKGIANGMPLSVYCGKREVMSVLGSDRVVVTSTFGGEALAISAALACLDVHRQEDVVAALWRTGRSMWEGVNRLCEEFELPMEVTGFWPCPSLRSTTGSNEPLMEFLRASFGRGVSLYPVPYVSLAHSVDDVDEALGRIEAACRDLHMIRRVDGWR